MYPPPHLTPKERALVPYLAMGISRRELSSKMGVSPETVKAHVRNILRKYDAVNLNDAISHLRQHSEYFFGPFAVFDVFCHSKLVETVINTKTKKILTTITQELEAIAPAVTAVRTSILDTPATLIDVRIDRAVANDLGVFNGRQVFENTYPAAKQRGDCFSRVTELTWDMHDDPFQVKYIAGWLTYPTSQFEMNIQFISDTAPKKITTGSTVSHHPQRDISLHSMPTRCGVRMVTHNPNIYKTYLARWAWK